MVEKSNIVAPPKAESENPKAADTLDSMDWEDRLAAAREQRARIQAEQKRAGRTSASEQSPASRPKPWDIPTKQSAASSKDVKEELLKDSDWTSRLKVDEKISLAEVVPGTMEWEDRILKLREQRDKAPVEASEVQGRSGGEVPEKADPIQIDDAPTDITYEWPPAKVNRTRPAPQLDQPAQDTAPAAALVLDATADKGHRRAFGWRTAAGFAVGAAFGLGVSSSDMLTNAARVIQGRFSVATSVPPQGVTLIEFSQLTPGENETVSTAISTPNTDQAVVLKDPDRLAVMALANSQSVSVPRPPTFRPVLGYSATLEFETATLAGTPRLLGSHSDEPATPAPVPLLSSPSRPDVSAFLSEPADWFRLASTSPDMGGLTTPIDLLGPVVAPLYPSIAVPDTGDMAAEPGVIALPKVPAISGEQRFVVETANWFRMASLAPDVVGAVAPAKLPEPKADILMLAVAAPGRGEVAVHSEYSPRPQFLTMADEPVLSDEQSDWFRLASIAPDVVGSSSPTGLSQPEANLLSLPSLVSGSVTSQSAYGAPVIPVMKIDSYRSAPLDIDMMSGPGVVMARSVAVETPALDQSAGAVKTDPVAVRGVLVHILAPSTLSDDRLNGAAEALRNAGYALKDPARVGFKVSQSNVRFYSAGDAENARALAEIVGGTVRDFTSYSPSPPAGTIEVWLAGAKPTSSGQVKRTTARAKPKPTRTKVRTKKASPDLTKLRNRLAEQLRRGDHL